MNKTIYFLITAVLMNLLNSCISREEYMPVNNNSGTIEFVARPVSYNGQTVQTRATSVDDFENKIHNCYFMLFNSAGDRVIGPIDMDATLTTQRISKHEILSKLGSQATCTACFIANVPVDVVNGLTTLDAVNSAVLGISYSSVDVQDTNKESKLSSFVIPEFDLDGNGSNGPVQCLPMFGMEECNLANNDLFQISLKRLFAKVSIEISVSTSSTSFDLLAAHLLNLPNRVKLSESDEESEWVEDGAAFLLQDIEGPIDGEDIHNYGSILGSSTYEFYFYVPEYCLLPTDDGQNNLEQKLKPKMYDTKKFPVLVKLFGNYDGGDVEQPVTYDLYMGENSYNSFTLKRNIHYKNCVKIAGVTNSTNGSDETLDWRVVVEELNEVEILGQTANCYIIGKTGSYIYPACKGVYKGGLQSIPDNLKCTKGDSLKLLKRDNTRVTIENLAYKPETGEFSFDVTSINTSGGTTVSNDENIVLGLVYEEDGQKKIEWSWHFWFVSGAAWNVDAFDISTQIYPNTSELMDRNLGAKPTLLQQVSPGIVSGLYYKYGHKEPYIDDGYYGGGESSSYDWSTEEKSQTDPCPPGYRVPASTVWEQESSGTTPVKAYYTLGDAFEYWEDVYYPYAGEVRGKNIVNSENKTYTLTTNDGEVIANKDIDPIYGEEYREGWSTYRSAITQRIAYYDFKYSIDAVFYFGQLLNKQYDNVLKYGYVDVTKEEFKKNCVFLSCKTQTFQTEEIQIRRGNFITGYTWERHKVLEEEPLTDEAVITNSADIQADWLSALADDQCPGNIITGYHLLFTDCFYSELNTAYGYQIRCVKE